MAHFVGVVDPDPRRRGAFAAQVRDRVGFLPGLSLGGAELGDLTLMWAVGPRAPLTVAQLADRLAVIFGDAIPGPGPERLDAATLPAAWFATRDAAPAAFDGYHAAVAYVPGEGLRVGVDILGMFPMYWWHHAGVTLFGSSAALFPRHPLFRLELDPHGLAGILTLNGVAANRTIYQGVRRLPAGRVLAAPPAGTPREVVQYALPESDRYIDISFDHQLEALDEAMASAMRRLVPSGEAVGLLLSGGMDSRALAGYLHRQSTETIALTMGIRRDNEARCAELVARALGFEHRIRADDPDDPVGSATTAARWEHLSGGFYGALGWEVPWMMADLPARVVAGYALDFTLAPKRLGATPALDADAAFDTAIERGRRWGLPGPAVAELLGRPRVVEEVLDALRAEFRARSTRPVRMRWKHNLSNRARFHLGMASWRVCFGSWPVLPVLDRNLLEAVAGLPVATISGRRAERELIRTRFPGLARLPIDRNSYDTTPIEPPTLFLVRQGIANRLRRVAGPLTRHLPAPERRFYYRTADFNRPQWRAVRRAADALRPGAAAWLEPAALDRVLPRADVTIQVADAIMGSSGFKLLTGFLLWTGSAVDS